MAALATSNVQNHGIGGGRRMVTGQWTGSEGDDAATLAVAGTTLYGAQFLNDDANYGSSIPVTWSVTTGVITVTLQSILEVTDGTFFLIVG